MDLVLPERHLLDDAEAESLALLVASWQMLADLSFSDLVLWVPEEDDNIFWAAAQARPTTGPTALTEDVVGERIVYDPHALVTTAYMTQAVASTSEDRLDAGIPVDVHALPILSGGRCVAVVERHNNRLSVRATGSLEVAYLDIAEILTDMMMHDSFPVIDDEGDPALTPQVGDGVIRLDHRGVVAYASPNAITVYRHLGLEGDLVGERLGEVTTTLSPVRWPVHESLAPGRARMFDVEGRRGAQARLRLLPLVAGGVPRGAVVMARDVTELRRRERQLITKDATIREIHHRVKNNLQTVSALLRLQSRRIESAEGKEMLQEAMNRVSAIAMVHETLSRSHGDAVEFDGLCDRLLSNVAAVAAPLASVATRREGSFGDVPGDAATTLSLVINELIQNAVEHGFPDGRTGQVVVRAERGEAELLIEVLDDGVGLPDGFAVDGARRSLGLSIVETLVADVGGTFVLTRREDRPGTVGRLQIPLPG